VTISSPVAFGQDGAGGVYVVSMGGTIYKLSENPPGTLKADPVVTGLAAPMNVAGPPGDTSRLFAVERAGRVVLRKGGVTSTFLDIHTQVTTDGEHGMSSIAFSPDYATSGCFYIMYTDVQGAIHIEEFRRSVANPDVADPGSQRDVLVIPHPDTEFHYGGQLQFGPDGYLYLSTGDGGGDDDEFNNAQNLGKLLGKLVRIDVSPATPAPPPPPGPAGTTPDTRAPRFFTKTKRRQRVLRLGGVVVYARCPGEGCRVSLSARLRIGKLSYPLRRSTRRLGKGKRVRMRARLTRRARRALRDALHDHARARVDATVRAHDAAGNRTKRHRVTVRVRP
jgi:glucose/sorbosone dehydrogenase